MCLQSLATKCLCNFTIFNRIFDSISVPSAAGFQKRMLQSLPGLQWPEAISKQATKDRICRVELSLRHTLLGISTG